MGPARRNKARRPPSEPEQKAGTPVRTQGRTAEGFHRRRRQAQPVPSPGLRLPELFQTERFIGVYHTPIFIKMQSFFSEIAWNSTQKLPAVRLHRQTKGARAPPGARAAHASIQFASEPRSAAAAAVISTAAAVPAATGIPTAPAVPTAAAEDDDQHDDPQAASAAPAVIAAPHNEYLLIYELRGRLNAALNPILCGGTTKVCHRYFSAKFCSMTATWARVALSSGLRSIRSASELDSRPAPTAQATASPPQLATAAASS